MMKSLLILSLSALTSCVTNQQLLQKMNDMQQHIDTIEANRAIEKCVISYDSEVFVLAGIPKPDCVFILQILNQIEQYSKEKKRQESTRVAEKI